MGAYLRRKQRLYADSRNFFLSISLSHVESGIIRKRIHLHLSDDVFLTYCSGWYWKFLRKIDLKSRHAKCVRSAWPECIDTVARCYQLYNVCVYGAWLAARQLFNVCLRYGATIFPMCLANSKVWKISLILSSFSFWRKNHTNQRQTFAL